MPISLNIIPLRAFTPPPRPHAKGGQAYNVVKLVPIQISDNNLMIK